MDTSSIPLGDRWYIVISAYFVVLLPWAFMQKIDFISSSWKTVRRTRRNGLIQFWFTLIPLTLMLPYIWLQIEAQDFKEMSAAILAFIFALIHLVRTWWGLWQIRIFKEWAENSIRTLESQGISYNMLLKDKDNEKIRSMEKEEIFSYKADLIQVNDTIVDNQIMGGDTKCDLKLNLPKSLRFILEELKKNLKKLLQVFQGKVLICIRLITSMRYIKSITGWIDPTKNIFSLDPKDATEVWIRWATTFSSQGLSKWIRNYDIDHFPGNSTGKCLGYEIRKKHFAKEIITSAFLLKEDISRTKKVTYHAGHPLQWEYGSQAGDEKNEECWFHKTGKVSQSQMLRYALRTGKGLPFGAKHIRTDGRRRRVSQDLERSGLSIFEYEVEKTARSMPPKFGNEIDNFDYRKLESLTIMLNLGRWIVEEKDNDTKEDHKKVKNEKDSCEHQISILTRHVGLPNDLKEISGINFKLDSFTGQETCGPFVIPVFRGSEANKFGNNWNVTDESTVIDVWHAMRSGTSIEDAIKYDEHLTNEMWKSAQRESVHTKFIDPYLSSVESSATIGSQKNADQYEEEEEIIENFESDGVREQNSIFVKRILARDFEARRNPNIHLEQSTSFLGIAMESLRSSLARHAFEEKGSEGCDWTPSVHLISGISDQLLCFEPSRALCSGIEAIQRQNRNICDYFERKNVQIRLVWEMQREIIKRIGKKTGPENPVAILACILSFSSLAFRKIPIQENTSNGNNSNEPSGAVQACLLCLHPVYAPQSFFVEVRVSAFETGSLSNKYEISAYIRNKENEEFFDWEMWRDAFIGRMIGAREWKEDHEMDFFREYTTFHGISNGFKQIRFNQGRSENFMNVWMGWLPMQPQICEFELKKEDEELSENEMSYRRALLEEQVAKISENQKSRGPMGAIGDILFGNEITMDNMVVNAVNALKHLGDNKSGGQSNNALSIMHVAAANGHVGAYDYAMEIFSKKYPSDASVQSALSLTEDFIKYRKEQENDSIEIERKVEEYYMDLVKISNYRATVVRSLSKFERSIGHFKHDVTETEMLSILRNSFIRTESSMILWEMIWFYSYCGKKTDRTYMHGEENKIEKQFEWLYGNIKSHLKRIFNSFFEVHDHDNSSSEDRHLTSLVFDVSHGQNDEDEIIWMKSTLENQLEQENEIIKNYGRSVEHRQRQISMQKENTESLKHEIENAKYRRRKISRVLGNLYKSNLTISNDAPFLCVYYHGLAIYFGSEKSIKTLENIMNDDTFTSEEIGEWILNIICSCMARSTGTKIQCGVAKLSTRFLTKYQHSLEEKKKFIKLTMENISSSSNYDEKTKKVCSQEIEKIEEIELDPSTPSKPNTELDSLLVD